MKLTHSLFLLSLASCLSITSCLDPSFGSGYSSGRSGYGGGYNSYASLPNNYIGGAYLYNGRYYSGGNYQTGSYNHQGRTYANRYYHNGQYYYGGSHQNYGSVRRDADDHGHASSFQRPTANQMYQPYSTNRRP